MAVAPKKLDLHDGDVVEIEGRRYDVVPDKQGGLTLEPAITITVDELRRRHGGRAPTQQEIADQLPGLLSPDGEADRGRHPGGRRAPGVRRRRVEPGGRPAESGR